MIKRWKKELFERAFEIFLDKYRDLPGVCITLLNDAGLYAEHLLGAGQGLI